MERGEVTQFDENAKDTNVLTMMIANDINVVTKNDENAKEGENGNRYYQKGY
jgi:hypothetical protein